MTNKAVNMETFKKLVKRMTREELEDLISFNAPFAHKNKEVMNILLTEKESRHAHISEETVSVF